jgi:hypothetical protein
MQHLNSTWLGDGASVATALGVFCAAWQLLQAKKQAVTSFEDELAEEYRTLCSKLPIKVFFGESLTSEEMEEHLHDFYTYFDLSNSQLFFRQIGRVSESTWVFWADGMRYNLSLAAFSMAWSQIGPRVGTSFHEYRKAIESNFSSDPKRW